MREEPNNDPVMAIGISRAAITGFADHRLAKKSIIALRCLASGNGPRPALMLSARWAGLVVPGITAVTASWPSRNFKKNCGQVVASNSRAHSGTLLPRTAENTELRP